MIQLRIFVCVFLIIQVMGNPCDVDFSSANYKTMRFGDGRIFLGENDKYYLFQQGHVRNYQENKLKETLRISKVDQCFIQNRQIFYLSGDKLIVQQENGETKEFSWKKSRPRIHHLEILKSGQMTGFFAPLSNGGWGQSYSMMNDLQIIGFGGGSISTNQINNNLFINYNGYTIPEEFNAYLINNDGSITFFNGDKYAVSRKTHNNFFWFFNGNTNSNNQLEWKPVNQYFGCN